MTNFIRPCEGTITSPYGMRFHPVFKENRMHWGVDIAKAGNVPIYASATGKVSRVIPNGTVGGYGNAVILHHVINGVTYETLYAHLKSVTVKLNQTVLQGKTIVGYMGNTGVGTGQHLHFELHAKGTWNGKFTNAVNPLHYISDPEVKEIQHLLVSNHGYKLTVDGIRGDATDKAIEDFQRKNRLTVDGVVGTGTMSLLKKKTAVVNSPTPSIPKPIVSTTKGDEDELKFSSPALQKETEFSLASKAHREMIVQAAIKAGANKAVWENKLKTGEITDADLLGLSVKYLIAENK